MSTLSPDARRLLDDARALTEPTSADQDRVFAALRARIAAGDPGPDAASPDTSERVPPANTASALARKTRSRWLLGGLLALLAAGGVTARALRSNTAPRSATAPQREASPTQPAVDAPSTTAPSHAADRTATREPAAAPFARHDAPRPAAPQAHAPTTIAPSRAAAHARRTSGPVASAPSSTTPASDASSATPRAAASRPVGADATAPMDPPGATAPPVDRGELDRADALLARGLPLAALAALGDIAEAGPRHPRFGAALPRIAELARTLRDPAPVIPVLARYTYEHLDASSLDDDSLVFLLAHARYDAGQLDDAVRGFRRIAPASRWYLRARVLEAAAHVQQHHAAPAADALAAAQDALEHGRAASPLDPRDRTLDLLWLQRARLYYSTGHYAAAIDAYAHVRREGERFADALFEQAWAYFLAGESERALGNVVAVNTGYFPAAFYPESLVLRAVILHDHCQYGDAEAALHKFDRRYGETAPELRALAASLADDDAAALRALREARGDRRDDRTALRALLVTAAHAGAVERALAYLDALQSELARVRALPPDVRAQASLERGLEDLELARSLAHGAAADAFRAALHHAGEELADASNQATAVRIEIASALRGDVGNGGTGAMPAQTTPRVTAQDDLEDGLEWPYEGEVWPDEVGRYRERVTGRCQR